MTLFRTNLLRFVATSATLAVTSIVGAQGYAPIIESVNLNQTEQLIINRGGPVDWAGDVNGDNQQDLLVGTGVGAVRVIFGAANGTDGVLNAGQLNGENGFALINDTQNNSLLAGLGDVNGDGLDDVSVASVSGTRVVFGSSEAFPRALNVTAEEGILDGGNGFVFGSAATDVKRAGDVNGDGLADFIVGNANATPNGLTGAGISYVIFGDASGFPAFISPGALTGDNGFAVLGITGEDRSGRYVSGAGDFNNDGFDDVLIGAPHQTTNGIAEAGAAYLVLGADSFPAVISLADIDGNNGFMFEGSGTQDLAGAAVSAVGDVNHDGIDDIAIGAPGKGPFGIPSNYPGEAYVLFGGNFNSQAVIAETDLDGTNGFVLRGIRGGVIPIEADQAIWGDLAGADIDNAGDMNGDGIDDIVIGAPHSIISPQRKGVGQAYVVFGSTSAFPALVQLADLDGGNGFRINGTGTVNYYAVSVASATDFDADGRDDILIGASGAGESYVFYGRDTGLSSVGTAPTAPTGAMSTGFVEAGLTFGADAMGLAFDELEDPTGPNPLPPGTSTDPLDPATPGFTAAYALNTAEPVRPVANETVPEEPEEESPADSEPETPEDSDGESPADSEGDSEGEASSEGSEGEASSEGSEGGAPSEGSEGEASSEDSEGEASSEDSEGEASSEGSEDETPDNDGSSEGELNNPTTGSLFWLPLLLAGFAFVRGHSSYTRAY